MFRAVQKIFPLLILITIMSCATDNDAVRDLPEYSEALIEKVNGLLDSGQYTRALHLCRIIDDGRISGIEKKAFTGLETDYHKAVDEQRYLEAAQYLKSLTAAGWETEDSLSDIYMSYVMNEIDENAVTPALALFQQKIIRREAEISAVDEQLEKLFTAAVENKNRVVLQYLLETYPDFSNERVEAISALTEYTPEKAEMISGTVTIWVDRGIRIEKGVGYPDRVIGSGFYIDSRGYILTNYHVISSEVDTEYEGFSRLYIKYDKNEEKIPASVVGWDASLDIALIKVAYTPEYIYSFPEIREFKPGEKIYAIGSPGGLDKTITSGIISASGDRRLLPLGDTIQVDVPINSGNSGGPVVDNDGNLVGVVFAGIE
ncbi:MAG TPA: hypothetical protein DCO79_06970, partial [Spirochaeta sp.]|nr:hypothetical protein [Spirochaeta sp.]